MPSEIRLHVHELLLSADASRAADGRVSLSLESADPRLFESASSSSPLSLSSEGRVSVEWGRRIELFPGGRAWDALSSALASHAREDSDIYLSVRAESGAPIGEAFVNLEEILAQGKDMTRESVKLLGRDDKVVGRLTVSVEALQALRLVQSGGGGGLASMVLAAAAKTAYSSTSEAAAPTVAKSGSWATNQLVIAVHKLLVLADALPAGELPEVSVSIEPADKALIEGRTLQTTRRRLGKDGAADWDWSHTIELLPGGQAWEALRRSLASEGREDSDIYFMVHRSGGLSVGEAYVNLEEMLASERDLAFENLKVLGADDKVVGRLTVSVTAVEAMRRTKDASAATGAAPPSGHAAAARKVRFDHAPATAAAGEARAVPVVTPTTYHLAPGEVGVPVRLLKTTELGLLLSRRGIALPQDRESHAQLLETCRSHGLFTVAPAELHDVRSLIERDNSAPGALHAAIRGTGTGTSSPQLTLRVGDFALAPAAQSSLSLGARLRLKVEIPGMAGARGLQTESVQPVNGRTSFACTRTVDANQDAPTWAALVEALAAKDDDASDVLYSVFAEDGRGTPARGPLGEGYVNLKHLVARERELRSHRIEILNDEDSLVGTLDVSIEGVQAMRALEEAASDRSSAPPRADVNSPMNSGVSGSPHAGVAELTAQVSESVPRKRHHGHRQEMPRKPEEWTAIGEARETLARRRGRNIQPAAEQVQSARSRAEQTEAAQRDAQIARDASKQLKIAERELEQARRDEEMRRSGVSLRNETERDRAAALLQARIRKRNQTGGHTGSHTGGSATSSRAAGRAATDSTSRRTPSSSPPTTLPRYAATGGPPDARRGSFPQDTNSSTEVERALVVAFERLGEAKAQLTLAQKANLHLEKQLAIVHDEKAQLTRKLNATRTECEQHRAVMARRHLAQAGPKGTGKAQQAYYNRSTERSALMSATSRAQSAKIQRQILSARAGSEQQLQRSHRRLEELQDALATEQRLRQQAEKQVVQMQQQMVALVASMNLTSEQLRDEAQQRNLLEQTIRELRRDLDHQAVMLEAEQEMRMALQAGETNIDVSRKAMQDGGARSSSTRFGSQRNPSATPGSVRGAQDRTRREHVAAAAIQRTWHRRADKRHRPAAVPGENRRYALKPRMSGNTGVAPATPPSTRKHGQAASLSSPQRQNMRVSMQSHKWASERDRNAALRLQRMAEELALAISEQDRIHAVTQRHARAYG